MPDEVQAFLRREELQRDRDELDDLVEAPRSRRAQKRFQLRKREFNGIEIGTVGRQKAEARPDAFNGGLHLRLFVHRQVVEHDHVAGAERRDEHVLDVGEKRGVIEWPVEYRRRGEPLDAQRRDHGVRLPVPIRRVIAVAPQQIGGDAGLVEEDVAARVMQRQRVLPLPPRGRDISAALFVGEYRFF
jgi:hypothetical protein